VKLETKIIYGPIFTRRFGWDIGVNLLPVTHKLCTFDCIYCQYGALSSKERPNFPTVSEIISSLSEAWESFGSTSSERLHLTIAGNGEPTMHPQFAKIAQKIKEWRDQNAPGLKLALLSNGYRLHQPKIRKTMTLFDESIIKLDCAIQEKIKSVNQPIFSFHLEQFIEDLKKCNRLIIQTMFVKGYNDGADDLRKWMEALKKIQPAEVQIYTISRTPPNPISPISNSELQSIANGTSSLIGIPVRAYLTRSTGH
jgi:wyosine [tRNA(Phe)-imidazoG37] synthetase (radical SAM superfamily)